MGYHQIESGPEYYKTYFEAQKKDLNPFTKALMPYDEFAKVSVQVTGALMCLAGLLIAIGDRRVGPILVILQMSFLIGV